MISLNQLCIAVFVVTKRSDIARIKLSNEISEQEIARLKAMLKKATQERDILKKATEYFASLEK